MIDPILSAHQLPLLDEPVIVDLGVNRDGLPPRDAYRSGHITGAVFLDLDTWLAGPPTGRDGRHPLPDREVFAEGLRRSGIEGSNVVVAYDRVGGVFAARLVWMLRSIGVQSALLDGGLDAWHEDLQTGEVIPARSTFAARDLPSELIVGLAEMTQYAHDVAEGKRPEVVLLDARESSRYRGEPHALDVVSGHIPGARSLPCRDNLDETGWLLPAAELARRFAAVGVDSPDTPVISSCGSGVTACHNLLVMEQLGLGRGRLYPGSWSQWSSGERVISVGAGPVATLMTVVGSNGDVTPYQSSQVS